MPRLPLINQSDDSDIAALIQRIENERGGKLLLLYQVLLNSPPVAEGWLDLLTAVRQKTIISGAIRELIILRIAVLNGARYEFENHTPYALSEGISPATVAELADGRVPRDLPERHAIALDYAEEITRNITIKAETKDHLSSEFDNREILELTVISAAYNMVSRVLVALDVDHDPKD